MGGVVEGQTFLAPLPENYTGERLNIPTGHWKDGLFGCFNYGLCNASVWCAICCPQRKSFVLLASYCRL